MKKQDPFKPHISEPVFARFAPFLPFDKNPHARPPWWLLCFARSSASEYATVYFTCDHVDIVWQASARVTRKIRGSSTCSVGVDCCMPFKNYTATFSCGVHCCTFFMRSLGVCCAFVQAYVEAHPDEFLMPTGFIYHETRTGSTLVANMLAHVPTNLVMSEHSIAENPIRGCANCSPSQTSELLQLLLRLLATAKDGHTNAFFKFSDATGIHSVSESNEKKKN